MDYRQEYEQELDLKGLLFHILYRWKLVLASSILVCVLAAGYTALYNRIIFPGEKADIEEQIAEQEKQMAVLAEGQSPEPIQKQVTELTEKLKGLEKCSYTKYCAVGFVGGLFVMVFCCGMRYVCSDRIRGERELRDQYGYYLLGMIPKKQQGINHFLEKLEGTSEQVTEAEAYRIISTNIANLAEEGATILVTGTVDEAKLKMFTEIVSLQVENVSLVSGANMNATANTLKALAMCDMVVLVEERDRSLRRKVRKECESIGVLNKVVLGYVVL